MSILLADVDLPQLLTRALGSQPLKSGVRTVLSPTNISQVCGRDGLAAMLAAKRLAGVAPDVNLREGVTHMPPPSVNKVARSGFETQRRRHQKSKTGLSVAPLKGLVSSQFFLKKEKKLGVRKHTCVLGSTHRLWAWQTCGRIVLTSRTSSSCLSRNSSGNGSLPAMQTF